MKTFAVSTTLLIILLMVCSCGGAGGSGGRPPVAPALEGQAALDAQATLAVWSAQGTAVAEGTRQAAQATADAQAAIARATADTQAAWATGTAVAGLATNEAAAVATGVAQATATASAVEATATWGALAVQAEAIAVQQTADAGLYYLNATATADAGIQAFMEAEAAQTVREREAAVARQQMWVRLTPWLLGAVVLVGGALVVLVVGGYMVERVRRARPQPAGDTWVMWHPEGPRVIAPPRPAPPRIEQPQPRALLPAGPLAPVAPVELPPLSYGHVMFAGPTDAGKSTAMRAVLASRANVVVLDPHSAGNDWGRARVIGAGRDFEAIRDYMQQMERMLRERYAQRAAGHVSFAEHTVAVDEMPAIVAAIGSDIEAVWRAWLREGRKVGLFLALSTQSTRVRTLGIQGEGDLLSNFRAVLVLGDLARQEYAALVAGMERPAILRLRGQARPVIIPHVDNPAAQRPAAVVDARGAGDLDGDGDADAILLPPVTPLHVAPLPTYGGATAGPDPDNLTPADRQRIVELYRAYRNMAAVQREMFQGYSSTGGRAFYAIRETLVEAGLLFS